MRDKIKLVSSEGTGHYYTTTKNKCTMPEKLEMKPEKKEIEPITTEKPKIIQLNQNDTNPPSEKPQDAQLETNQRY